MAAQNLQARDSQERGRNVLEEEKRKSIIVRFLNQLNDPLIYILFVAAAISLLLGEYADMAIILAVVILNACVGVIQEGKAQKALEALKKMTSPHAMIRQGTLRKEILAADLMPGDIVCLEAGRQVPADLRLTIAVNLKIEESSLTGESVPVLKNTGNQNKAYMSTNVTYGRGEGVVTAIGMDTEIGKIARMIQNTEVETTPLQKRLADLGKMLSLVSVVLCVLLFMIAVLQERDILEMLITAISLAVAAVPEGLPAIVTMVLALSVSKMVKVNTIVKRLPSVETLGCVSVVCSDKTGTLTQNRMTVTRCYTNDRVTPVKGLKKDKDQHFLYGFALCNDASISGESRTGDPTELALLDMSAQFGIDRRQLERSMPRMDELAFDSQRKMMTTMHKTQNSTVAYTKGSPDEILAHCTSIQLGGKKLPITKAHKDRIHQVISQFSSDALRVLALGLREGAHGVKEDDLMFVGLVGMADPVRPEAKTSVLEFKEAGVKTVMITGDRIDTACAIAKELGIASSIKECISGEQLQTMSENELRKRISEIHVFAHVSPEHKVRIVSAYKSLGEIVAMTGDGVNDAPSLKAADVGIAMGMAGTDVAKNAADIILTDDNFSTITKAIAQGRSIYDNIKKSVLFLLSSNFGEIITMLTAIICGLATPLKASHILWVNLITDSLPALALGIDNQSNRNDMKHKPRAKDESLFANGGLFCTLFYGVLIALLSTVAFLQLPLNILSNEGSPVTLEGIRSLLEDPDILVRSQTYAFTVLGMSEMFHAIGMRDVECSIFRMNHLSNKLMIVAFAVGIILQMMVTEIPSLVTVFGTCALSAQEWLRLLVLSAMPMLAHEIMLFSPSAMFKKFHHT